MARLSTLLPCKNIVPGPEIKMSAGVSIGSAIYHCFPWDQPDVKIDSTLFALDLPGFNLVLHENPVLPFQFLFQAPFVELRFVLSFATLFVNFRCLNRIENTYSTNLPGYKIMS